MYYRERREELWVKGTFYAFMSSSAYIFLKRFYLKELMGYMIYFLISIIGWIVSGVGSLWGEGGISMLSFVYWVDLDGNERGVASEMVRTTFGGDCGLLY